MENKKNPKTSKSFSEHIEALITWILSSLRLRREARAEQANLTNDPNNSGLVISLIDRRMSTVVGNLRHVMSAHPEYSLERKIEDVVLFFEKEYLEKKDLIREVFLLAPESGRLETLYKARVEVTVIISRYFQSKSVGFAAKKADQLAFIAVHSTLGIMESYVMLAPPYLSSDEISAELRKILRSTLL